MRLDRFLSETGFGTRTEVKKLIKQGRVKINGSLAKKPEQHLNEEIDTVHLDERAIKYRKYIYLMLNKPAGVVSATWDKKLPTVIDLLPEEYAHFEPFPVGRLDIDTEGLLILTNDGDLTHRLLSPKHHIPKTYIAQLENPPKAEYIPAFKAGLDLGDFVTLGAQLEILSENSPYTAKVTIYEGKFHQVKRMFEAVGNKVVYLKRIEMNGLCLDESLEKGEVRELTDNELSQLNFTKET